MGGNGIASMVLHVGGLVLVPLRVSETTWHEPGLRYLGFPATKESKRVCVRSNVGRLVGSGRTLAVRGLPTDICRISKRAWMTSEPEAQSRTRTKFLTTLGKCERLDEREQNR